MMGEAQGRMMGEAQGIRASILETLHLRFNEIPYGVQESLESITDISQLKTLHRLSVTAPSLAAFRSGS
jgi:hypothetical protein